MHQIYKAIQKLLVEQETVEFEQLREQTGHPSVRRLQVILQLLEEGGIVRRDKQLGYHLEKKDAKTEDLVQLAEAAGRKGDHDRQALERMVFYAQSGFCRWKVLLEYFNEEAEWDHCGHCDNCMNPPEKALLPLPTSDQEASAVAKPASTPSFPAGAMVKVPKVGKGQILSSTDEMVTIIFPDSQKRTFLKNHVELL